MYKKIKFKTTHHQFYLADSGVNNSEIEDLWTAEEYKLRTVLRKGFIGILTGSYGPINGELDILDKRSSDTGLDDWDYIVETGIDLRSGKLQILDCPSMNIVDEVDIKPDRYCVRIYVRGLKQAIANEEAGKDFYKIEIWKGEKTDLDIIKAL